MNGICLAIRYSGFDLSNSSWCSECIFMPLVGPVAEIIGVTAATVECRRFHKPVLGLLPKAEFFGE